MGWNMQAPENKGWQTLQHMVNLITYFQNSLRLSNPNFENQNNIESTTGPPVF
jgi:hypothetical protein